MSVTHSLLLKLKKIGKVLLTIAGALFLIQVCLILWFFIAGHQPRVSLQPKSLLTLTLSDEYHEYIEEDNLSRLFAPQKHSLYHVLKAIELAQNSPEILALVLRIDNNDLSMAMIQEIRKKLQDFKQSGKAVYVFTDTFGDGLPAMREYYLATVASEIWLQPFGELNLTGLSASQPFLRGFLDLLGIQPQIGKRQEYKSAPDMYMEKGFTQPNKEQLEQLLSSLENQMLKDIAADRHFSAEQLKKIMEAAPFTAEEGLTHKFIDFIGGMDDLRQMVKGRYGAEINAINYLDFLDNFEQKSSPKTPKVAVFYAAGEIERDQGDYYQGEIIGESILSHRLARELSLLADDSSIKAVVLRIDSPGGSAYASETLALALQSLKKAGKPVVVSMGSVAASGGYWIATAANKIVAQPATLTGSIGVFAGKFNTQDLAQKIGVHWGEIATHEAALDQSMNQPYSPAGLKRLDKSLDRIYWTFVDKVAAARGMTREEAHKVAKGRVWTGEDALKVKLVDYLGGIDVAIEEAAKLAQLSPDQVAVEIYPRHKKFSEIMTDMFFGNSQGIEPLIKTLTQAMLMQTERTLQRKLIQWNPGTQKAVLSPTTQTQIR